MVGKLIYISHNGLDITYVVSVVSQLMHNLKGVQWRQLLGYLDT